MGNNKDFLECPYFSLTHTHTHILKEKIKWLNLRIGKGHFYGNLNLNDGTDKNWEKWQINYGMST